MLRWIATAAIALLFVLDLALPATPLGRRGTEPRARHDAPEAWAGIGARLPELALFDLGGGPVSLADFRGHPTLVTFERSVDW